jgi:hypothetical protein
MSDLTYDEEKRIRRHRRMKIEGHLHGLARQLARTNEREKADIVLAKRWLRTWEVYKEARKHTHRVFQRHASVKTS